MTASVFPLFKFVGNSDIAPVNPTYFCMMIGQIILLSDISECVEECLLRFLSHFVCMSAQTSMELPKIAQKLGHNIKFDFSSVFHV